MNEQQQDREEQVEPLWGKNTRRDNHKEQGNSRKSGAEAARKHRFPPLRKPWMFTDEQQGEPVDYQQQLKDGFQEGVSKGFDQGLIEGREEGYQQGKREGYAAGKKKGENEGRQAGRALFDSASRPFAKMIEQLQQAIHHYEQRRRQELVQLVEKVTRQVIRCELALQPAQLLELVEEALQAQPVPPEQLKVRLNAEEFERIKDVAPDKVEEWGLIADSDLEPGECKVITDSMEIDVGCEHRLEQCMAVLQDSLLTEEAERELHRTG